MSFSSELKEEISKTENLANKEAVKYELIGYLITSNISEEKNNIKFSTENEYNINRFARLLSNMEISQYDISMQGNLFVITVKKSYIEGLSTEKDLNLEQIRDVYDDRIFSRLCSNINALKLNIEGSDLRLNM